MNLLEAFIVVEAPAGTHPAPTVNAAWEAIHGWCRTKFVRDRDKNLREEALSVALESFFSSARLGDGLLAKMRRDTSRTGPELPRLQRYVRTSLRNALRTLVRASTSRRETSLDEDHPVRQPASSTSTASNAAAEGDDDSLVFDVERQRAVFSRLTDLGLEGRLATMPRRYHAGAREAWADYVRVKLDRHPFAELIARERERVAPKRVDDDALGDRLYKRHQRAREYVAAGLEAVMDDLDERDRTAAARIRNWLTSKEASCQGEEHRSVEEADTP